MRRENKGNFNQERQIAQANKVLAEKRLLTPPNIRWDNSVAFRYQGKVNRHNQISGNTFGFSRDLLSESFCVPHEILTDYVK